ncbi:MAG: carbon-nitrogen hydrolase family protein [Acidimicrobiales bacterium]
MEVGMGSSTWVVAAVQTRSDANRDRNVEATSALVERAARAGATYVQVPELVTYLGPPCDYGEVAEPIAGPTVEHFATLARRLGVTLHLGSVLERSTTPGRVHNTSVVIGPDGALLATYRKVHLFDIAVPGQVEFRESDAIAPGSQLVVVDVGPARLGLSICFDVRFPELYRALALAGATVLAIPAAFSAVTGPAHWETLVRARAIENHAYVVAAAQAGTTPEGVATNGDSMIVGPWGEVLARARGEEPEVLVASLDLDQVRRRREQIAVLALRRPDVYARAVQRGGSDAVRASMVAETTNAVTSSASDH